ncbi:histidine phosphatase family protein [Cutibacterium equinum]|uniref:Histidine phosphatase family protein n=1 Tax=Cutibacterium equinum TaxID=3016342 RepID=A0ABY7QZX9_9ACTN|nr:histidine phosphatase family protein [Cutibacterium equinum]WCC80606.1 histidine phosphatase family protein [Cutibacterium equinum]
MHLLLIRHGQSENNALAATSAEAYRQGRKPDPELTELGRRQAEALGAWIGSVSPRPTVLYSSPMMRTIQTAAPLAEVLDLPITVSDLIFERPGPVQMVDEVETGHPGSPLSTLSAITDRAVFPETVTEEGWREARIETAAEAADRAGRIAEWVREAHDDDECIALVAHGAIGSMLLLNLMAPQLAADLRNYPIGGEPQWVNLHNTSTSMIELHPDGYEVHWINRVDHLIDAGMVHGAVATSTGNPGTR